MVFIYFPDIQRVSFKKYGLKLLSHTVPLSKTASLRRNYRHLGDGKAATATLFVPTIEPPKTDTGKTRDSTENSDRRICRDSFEPLCSRMLTLSRPDIKEH